MTGKYRTLLFAILLSQFCLRTHLFFTTTLENDFSLKLALASGRQAVKERAVGPGRRCGLSRDISTAGLLRSGGNGRTTGCPVFVRVLEVGVVEDVVDVCTHGDLHPLRGVEILSHSEV